MSNSFDNSQNINLIQMTRKVTPFCPMGDAYYDANIKISLAPDKLLADYIDITDIIDSLNNESYIIEDIANSVVESLVNIYKPLWVTVIVEAESEKHLEVRVVKNWHKDD